MLYVDKDDKEHNYDPPLSKKEMELSGLSPLALEPFQYDHSQQKIGKFVYDRQPNGAVIKRAVLVDLTVGERFEYARKKKLETMEATLPPYAETCHLVFRVLAGLIERQQMTVDPKDPRTSVLVSDADIEEVRRLASLLGS